MDEKDKPEKLFHDETTGLVHDAECPRTKKEFGQEGGGECPNEPFVKMIHESVDRYMEQIGVPKKPASSSSGPAQVSTPKYREGWDQIFGSKKTVGQA